MTQAALKPLRESAAFLDAATSMPEAPREPPAYQHVLSQLPERLLEGGEVHSARILAAVDGWRWGHGSLVLLGPTGIGKTTAAVALVSRLVSEASALPSGHRRARAAHSVLFTSAQRLANARRESGLGIGRPSLVERACRVRLLVIDDLGAEPPGDVEIGAILDERYGSQRPVVVTAGLTKGDLATRYSAAFLRRVRECGRREGVVVEDFTSRKAGK